MAKNGAFQQIESEYKKPMADILPTLFEELGSQEKVARHLKVSQSTVSKWLSDLDFKTWTVIKKKPSNLKQPQPSYRFANSAGTIYESAS